MQVLYLLSYVGSQAFQPLTSSPARGKSIESGQLERETGFEPATLSLEG